MEQLLESEDKTNNSVIDDRQRKRHCASNINSTAATTESKANTSVANDEQRKICHNTNASNFGTFASAQQLWDAYKSLQKEFTKRCQRLKELQTMIDLAKNATDNSRVDNTSEIQYSTDSSSSNTVLPSTIAQQQIDRQQADDGQVQRALPAESVGKDNATESNDRQVQRALPATACSLAMLPLLREESFVQKHIVSDPQIVGMVIKSYLEKLQRQNVVPTLGIESGSALLTPFRQPKNLAEAKSIVDKLFLV